MCLAFISWEYMQGAFTEARMWYRGGLHSSKVLCALEAVLDGWGWEGWKDTEAPKPGRPQLSRFAERQLKQSCLGMEMLEQNQMVRGEGRGRKERKKADKNTQPQSEMGCGPPG